MDTIIGFIFISVVIVLMFTIGSLMLTMIFGAIAFAITFVTQGIASFSKYIINLFNKE